MFALKCAIPYRLQEALLSEAAAVTWGEGGSDAQRESKYGHAHLHKLQKWRFVAVFRKRAPPQQIAVWASEQHGKSQSWAWNLRAFYAKSGGGQQVQL